MENNEIMMNDIELGETTENFGGNSGKGLLAAFGIGAATVLVGGLIGYAIKKRKQKKAIEAQVIDCTDVQDDVEEVEAE